ncbi:MAG: hypothetical protein ACI9F9_002161, partial [Candidatus Paceibacteria bacterium]
TPQTACQFNSAFDLICFSLLPGASSEVSGSFIGAPLRR